MSTAAEPSTWPTLLRKVAQWDDHASWRLFHDRYDPLLKKWCRKLNLDEAASDELCQIVWIDVAKRVRNFQYDPARRFRGWLRRVFDSRATDQFRQRQQLRRLAFDAPELLGLLDSLPTTTCECEPASSDISVIQHELSELCDAIQRRVRARVSVDSWQAFWLTSIEGRSIREVADALGKTYTAVYYTRQRIQKLLSAEGDRWRLSPGNAGDGIG